MKRYNTYKDSGIEWIGEIPGHWDLKKMKYSVEKIDEIILASNLLIAVENIESGTGRLIGLEKKNNYEGHINGFKKGDVIFNKLRPYLSKVYRAEKDGGCFGELLILRGANNQMENGFLFYLMFSKPFIDTVDSSTHGTKMPRANWDSFIKQMGIPIPSFEEQTQIANYLDQKTTEIDTLITKKEQLIKLLEEERTAMINQAVTKGLDPSVPMKDSGIDWLGEIPEHWEVTRLANFGKFYKGRGVTKADLTDEGVNVVLYGDIYTKYLYQATEIHRKTSIETANKSVRIFKGDLLFTASGETQEAIGSCVVLETNEETYASGDVIIFRQNICDSRYLGLLFNSQHIGVQKAKLSKGEIVVHIYSSQLRNIHFPLPHIDEQIKIRKFLEKKINSISKAISVAETEIGYLKEYKTALISEVVTGKIDVREEVLN